MISKCFKSAGAQASLEWVLILSVVAVVALISVSMAFFLINPSQVQQKANSQMLAGLDIAILDSTFNISTGEFVLKVKNNLSSRIVLTGVQVGDFNSAFDQNMLSGSNMLFIVPSSDLCEGSEVIRKVTFTYYSKYGLEHRQVTEGVAFGCSSAGIIQSLRFFYIPQRDLADGILSNMDTLSDGNYAFSFGTALGDAIAYYSFDSANGSAVEDMVGSADGTLNSGASIGSGGQFGSNALIISDDYQYFDIPDFSSSQITITGWYYFESIGGGGGWNTIFCREGGSYHHLLINDDSRQIGFYNNSFYSSGTVLTPGTLYYLAVVKDGYNEKIYLNGSLIMNSDSSFDNSSYPFGMIGNYTSGGNQGAIGKIDDVKVWDRVLSESEILADFMPSADSNYVTKFIDSKKSTTSFDSVIVNTDGLRYGEEINPESEPSLANGLVALWHLNELGGESQVIEMQGLNLDFEEGSVGSCPTNWSCSGDALTASPSDASGCSVAGTGGNGLYYAKAGCDNTTGTLTSSVFTLPEDIGSVSFLRAGGADGGSGFYVKRASDNAVLCSSENGTDSDVFFEDSCTGLSSYAGTQAYIQISDNQNSGWGKVYLDNIRFISNAGLEVIDSSGNSYDGSKNSSQGSTDALSSITGLWGTNGGVFNGSSDYIDFGDVDGLNMHYSDVTVSAWVKTIEDKQARIFAKGVYGGSESGYALMTWASTGGKVVALWGNGTEHAIISDASVNDGKWHNLVAVFDRSGYMDLYIDGAVQNRNVQISSAYIGDHAENDIVASSDACIGRSCSGQNEYFDGLIDEVAIWNRTLSSSEVTDLFNKGAAKIGVSARACSSEDCSSDWSAVEYGSNEYKYFSLPRSKYFQFKITSELIPFDAQRVVPESCVSPNGANYWDYCGNYFGDSSSCSNNNWHNNSCYWYEYGYCYPSIDCSSQGGDTCGNYGGCYWNSGYCFNNLECYYNYDSSSCESYPACDWYPSYYCSGDMWGYCNSSFSDESSCNAASECTWDGSGCVNQTYCDSISYENCGNYNGYCYVYDYGSCSGDQYSYCANNFYDEGSCSSQNGCSWSPSYCTGDQYGYCNYNYYDSYSCNNYTNGGCYWNIDYAFCDGYFTCESQLNEGESSCTSFGWACNYTAPSSTDYNSYFYNVTPKLMDINVLFRN